MMLEKQEFGLPLLLADSQAGASTQCTAAAAYRLQTYLQRFRYAATGNQLPALLLSIVIAGVAQQHEQWHWWYCLSSWLGCG